MLVAIAMVAIVAMAALSIDVVTLYLARMEAQRAADAGALAAARVISVSGLTGDPGNTSWGSICGGSTSPATLAAYAAATQSAVDGVPVNTPSVMYSAGVAAPVSDCSSGLTVAFGVNPLITVKVTRNNLPTFFSRLWGNTGNTVNATAVAEVFNSSSSNTVTGSTIIPVQPRCVKPWMVPNLDPLNPSSSTCTNSSNCTPFVDPTDGHIEHAGISLNGTNANGVIGETFWLSPDCNRFGSSCTLRQSPPGANYFPGGGRNLQPPPSLQYLPAMIPATGPVAVPSCAAGLGFYQQSIAGCDQSTVYQCGVQRMNTIELTENPAADTTDGVECLIHEGNPAAGQPDGQDTLQPYSAPSSYPFQILAGSSNPVIASASKISASNSIVSVPIYDPVAIHPTGGTQVTIVGFLQVFINSVDQHGNVNVTVLNVTGCSNGSNGNVGTAVTGSSPVPIRLITAP